MTSDIPKEYSIKIPAGEVENKYVFGSNDHGGKNTFQYMSLIQCHTDDF
jgi:hypothetical protein